MNAPSKLARGCPQKGGWLKTVVILDDDTHAEVRAGAIANACSFAAQVRMLVEVGLETLKGEV